MSVGRSVRTANIDNILFLTLFRAETKRWDNEFNDVHRMKAEVVLTDCRIHQRRNQSLTTPQMVQRAAWYHQVNIPTRTEWNDFTRPQPGHMSVDPTRVNQLFAPDR